MGNDGPVTTVATPVADRISWVCLAEHTEVVTMAAVTISGLDIMLIIIIIINVGKCQGGANDFFKLGNAIVIPNRLSDFNAKDSDEKSGQAKVIEKIHGETRLSLNVERRGAFV